jgi:hypothetical protein
MVLQPRTCSRIFPIRDWDSADIISGKFTLHLRWWMMASPSWNPKRWYLLMLFCLTLSVVLFLVSKRLGVPAEGTREVALMVALWAPAFGIMGLRAELAQRKD